VVARDKNHLLYRLLQRPSRGVAAGHPVALAQQRCTERPGRPRQRAEPATHDAGAVPASLRGRTKADSRRHEGHCDARRGLGQVETVGWEHRI
jgi:hypothetical protein